MTVYATGSFLPKHIDNVPGQNLPTPNGYPSRDISSTVYYNENYKGGEIFFSNQNLKIKPTAGSLLLFPSNEIYVHEVLPVTSGIRYSSTNFWCLSK
jgi:predicted 2-oxoglutarate/Fe(II)-dependent dioxygenase YbiX